MLHFIVALSLMLVRKMLKRTNLSLNVLAVRLSGSCELEQKMAAIKGNVSTVVYAFAEAYIFII